MLKQCPDSGMVIYIETENYRAKNTGVKFLIENKKNHNKFIVPYISLMSNPGIDMSDEAIDVRIRQEEKYINLRR